MDYKDIFSRLLNQPIKHSKQKVLCPFHDDKNPSMSVDTINGKWFCHACGEGGTVYSLAKRLGYRLDDYGNLSEWSENEQQKINIKVVKKPKQPYNIEIYAQEKYLDQQFLIETFKLQNNNNNLVIPYFDRDNNLIYNKYRGFGKNIWTDSNINLSAYGLWLLDDFERDYILLVEGESDTQTLIQNDIPAIGIPGSNTLKEEMLFEIDDFNHWLFVIENDKGGLKFLETAFQMVNDIFPERMSSSDVILMSDVEKKDINELWKVNKQKERFLKRLDFLMSMKINLRIAYNQFIKNKKQFDEEVRVMSRDVYSTLKCIYKDNMLWVYNHKNKLYDYVVDDTQYLKDKVLEYGINKSTKINQMVSQLQSFIKQQQKIKDIDWEWIHFKNISVYYETLETKNFNDNYFITNRIPHNYSPSIKENPKVDELFSDWVDNPDILFGLIGYTFLKSYVGNKMFILYGVGDNGKTTFLNLLQNVLDGIGAHKKTELTHRSNITSANIKALIEDRFAPSLLYGKLANLSGEMPYSKLVDTTTIKQLTGNETITTQFKYGNMVIFKNYAKLIFATNKIPPTTDTSKGFFRRLVVVEFKEIPVSKRNLKILDTLTQEDYDYIVTKALHTIYEYAKNNFEFMNINEARKKYLDLSNPLKYFITNNCDYIGTNDDYVESQLFIDKFKKWLSATQQPTMSYKEIYDELKEMGIEKGRTRRYDGKQVTALYGIRWKNDTSNLDDEIPF